MQTQKNVVRLHNYFRSSASWRVRIALNLKKINYEYIPVNLLAGEQRNEAYAEINPMKHVPALEIDGVFLTESMAILEYLEETRQTPSLLPKDPVSRAKVRALCELINSGIQPLQNLKVLGKVEEMKGDKIEWAKYFIGLGLNGKN